MRRAIAIACVLSSSAVARAGDPPTVRVNDAADALAAAIAKHDPAKAKAGDTILVARIDKPDVKPNEAPVPMAVRATLAKHALTTLDEIADGATITITVEAANGARARIAVDAHGGAVYLTPRPAATKPAGKCVAIPSAKHPVVVHTSAIGHDGRSHHGNMFFDYKTARMHDVDGDGRLDAFVPIAKKHDCPEKVSFRVFVVRGTCGHDVGVVGPGSFQWDAPTTPLDASGFRPLTLEAQSSKHGDRGIPESITTTRRFVVENGAYVAKETKTGGGICHHCATWHCNSP